MLVEKFYKLKNHKKTVFVLNSYEQYLVYIGDFV